MRDAFQQEGLANLCKWANEKGATGKAVEIGAYSGEGTIVLAKYFKEVLAVDPWLNGYDIKRVVPGPSVRETVGQRGRIGTDHARRAARHARARDAQSSLEVAVDQSHPARHGRPVLVRQFRLVVLRQLDAQIFGGETGQRRSGIGDRRRGALKDVIAADVNIEEEATTEMEVIKRKEQRWKVVRGELQPFLNVADLWIATLTGLPVNGLDYRQTGERQ